MDSINKQIVWKGPLVLNSNMMVPAGLIWCGDQVTSRLWPGRSIKVLSSVARYTIPLVYFSCTSFIVVLDPTDSSEAKLVDRILSLLQPSSDEDTPQLALFAKIECGEDTNGDPFAASAIEKLPDSPYMVIYLERVCAEWRLTSHILHIPHTIEKINMNHLTASGALSTMSNTMDYYQYLEWLSKPESKQTKTDYHNSILCSTSTSLGPRDLFSNSEADTQDNRLENRKHIPLHSSRITLSDIENLCNSAQGMSTSDPDLNAKAGQEGNSKIEEANKKLAKQLVIAALKERGIKRDHPEFTALWGQVYKSLKFSLRDKIDCHIYSVRELRQAVAKHVTFYCT